MRTNYENYCHLPFIIVYYVSGKNVRQLDDGVSADRITNKIKPIETIIVYHPPNIMSFEMFKIFLLCI